MAARAPRGRRRPADAETDGVRALIRSHVPAAVAELARLACAASSETTRVAAINALIDRGYGGLKDGHDGDDSPHGITVRFLTPPEAP